jgi:hypothetical protein
MMHNFPQYQQKLISYAVTESTVSLSILQKILVSPSSGQHHDTSILIIPLIIHTAEASEMLKYFLQTTWHQTHPK